MNRLLFSISVLLANCWQLSAQTPADALRFSSFEVLGTARTVGVGGAIGALGADFSTISTNPAGLATFRRSEFTFTPSLFLNSTDATLNDGGAGAFTEDKLAFNLNNLGLVFAREGRRSNWRTSNFSIGINRIANFQQDIDYRGQTRGSYIDFLQEASIGLLPSELSNFTTGLGFDTQALYDLDDDQFYETDVELNGDAVLEKSETIRRRGGINELSFAYAGNFKERLMIGLAVGVPILSYTEEKVYDEADPNDEVPFYRSLQFNENLTTTGSGINAKLGLIFRVSQAVRIGAAVHTPTRFNLTDDYDTRMVYDYVDDDNDGPLESASPPEQSQFSYNFRTPWRFIGSAGFIIGRSGFISTEVEYLKYSGAEFELTANDPSQSTQEFQQNTNRAIANIYQSAINIRIGGEYALQMLRFRLGAILSGTPYADTYIQENPNIRGIGDTRLTYSAGLGLRQERFFLDLAIRLADQEGTYEPYSISADYAASNNIPTNSVTTNSLQSHLLLTFGYKF
ncbi:MAG: hypothetical protein AAGH79_01640 [Bacteroidota bacterium]